MDPGVGTCFTTSLAVAPSRGERDEQSRTVVSSLALVRRVRRRGSSMLDAQCASRRAIGTVGSLGASAGAAKFEAMAEDRASDDETLGRGTPQPRRTRDKAIWEHQPCRELTKHESVLCSRALPGPLLIHSAHLPLAVLRSLRSNFEPPLGIIAFRSMRFCRLPC